MENESWIDKIQCVDYQDHIKIYGFVCHVHKNETLELRLLV